MANAQPKDSERKLMRDIRDCIKDKSNPLTCTIISSSDSRKINHDDMFEYYSTTNKTHDITLNKGGQSNE